jgi:hypothetical protein
MKWSWLGKRRQKGLVEIQPRVLQCITDLLREHPKVDIVVKGYTEYKRDKVMFRAHPNYHSNGLWYDWVHIDWVTGPAEGATDQGNEEGEGVEPPPKKKCTRPDAYQSPYPSTMVPAKIVAFVSFDNHPKYDSEAMFAIIHSCASKTAEEGGRDTRLTEDWTLEYPTPLDVQRLPHHFSRLPVMPNGVEMREDSTFNAPQISLRSVLRLVNVDTFGERILVFEEEPGIPEFMELYNKSKTTRIEKEKELLPLPGSPYKYSGRYLWAYPSPKVLLIRDRTSFWPDQFLSWVRTETRLYREREIKTTQKKTTKKKTTQEKK